MSEEVLLISNLTAQCKWLLRAISDRLLGSYNHDVMWLNKDDIPLLKNFDPIGPPPNLLAK